MLNILSLLLLFAATVILSALQKVVFLLRYAHLVADAEITELIDVVIHGLYLDVTMAGYVCALPLLFVMLAIYFPSSLWKKLCQIYVAVAAALISVTFAVNLGLYGYWGFPLDGSILQFLATPKEAMASVTATEAVGYTLTALIYFALLWICYRECIKSIDTKKRISWRIKPLLSCAVLLCIGLDFLAIRGGVTTAVANVSKVYFSDKAPLNHAAVNPTFSLISSISDDNEFDHYNFFDDNSLRERFNALYADKTAQPTERLLKENRPNIVLIIAESFGRSTTDETIAGEAVAPNFQRLKGEGVWFENLIASSFRTDRGVLATLSGLPSQPTMSLMKYPQKASALPSIAHSLNSVGYSTTYIHGGDLNFTDMASYLYNTGFEKLVALKDLKFDAPTSKWGYADNYLSEYFADAVIALSADEKPYFAVWQTLSSHEPFDVPTDKFADKMLCSMYFADSCINSVIERLKASEEWDNTLVIIIADHAYNYPYGISASSVTRHRIPMLWVGGVIKQPAVITQYCSQSDFAATLLSQLELPHSDFTMSRDIFAPQSHDFGYYTFNNGFGVVDSKGATIYDCTQDKVISDTHSTEQVEIGKTLLQTTFSIIKEL